MKAERVTTLLRQIIDAIDRVETYLRSRDHGSFMGTPLVQDAVIRQLIVIGEASGRILKQDPEFCAKHPGIPLREAYATRNFLTHGYDGINLDVVLRTVTVELPAFRKAILAMIDKV